VHLEGLIHVGCCEAVSLVEIKWQTVYNVADNFCSLGREGEILPEPEQVQIEDRKI